jgi:hypothetical protein
MDRREALKKLGAAGAIAVGGSAVLSSRSVAFAASGECVATIPTTAAIRLSHSNAAPRRITANYLPSRPNGASSQTYSWRNATIVPPATGGVALLSTTQRSTTLERRRPGLRPRDQVWAAGDGFTVDVQITWTCRNGGPDVVLYRVSTTARLGTTWTVNANLVT